MWLQTAADAMDGFSIAYLLSLPDFAGAATLPTASSRAYPLALAAKAEAYRVFFERTGVAALGLKQGRLKKISDGLFQ